MMPHHPWLGSYTQEVQKVRTNQHAGLRMQLQPNLTSGNYENCYWKKNASFKLQIVTEAALFACSDSEERRRTARVLCHVQRRAA